MADTAHDIDFTDIEGRPLPLSNYCGKVLLVVNTASACGLTPQYAGLEQLWRDYRDRGLVVLGVPSNDFAGQEPGSEAEIKTFCETAFGVDFPLTSKVKVLGDDAHPFYRWAREHMGEAGEPKWNFHKILLDKAGQPIDGFGPRTSPTDPAVTAAIEAAL